MPAVNDFTKPALEAQRQAYREMYDLLPKKKQVELIGKANDFYRFMATVETYMPTGTEADNPKNNQ